MNYEETYAANTNTINNNKKDPINELNYGTILITYKSKSYLEKLFGNENKPKYANNILFNFENESKNFDKEKITSTNNFIFTESYNSPSPLIIKNTNNNKTFYKIISSLKIKKDIILSEFKILQTNKFFHNIIPSVYNCIYHNHDFNYIGHRKYILALGCIYEGTNFWRFIFSYNPNEINKEDVIYLLYHILYNKF